jgi:putative membrane protein
MLLVHHGGRVFDHGGWPLFGILPLLLMLVLIAVAVWAVLRVTGRSSVAVAGPVARVDPALEEIRLRYARGEIGREEFVQRSHDLGDRSPTLGSPGA